MALTVRKPEIIRRLTERLGLEIGPVAPDFTLLPDLRVTSSIDELLRKRLFGIRQDIAVTAVGTVTLFNVPAGKRWNVKFMRCEKQTGTFTLSGFYFWISTVMPPLKLFSPSATTLLYGHLDKDFMLDQNWGIVVNVDVLSVAGTVFVDYIYEEEDAY